MARVLSMIEELPDTSFEVIEKPLADIFQEYIEDSGAGNYRPDTVKNRIQSI